MKISKYQRLFGVGPIVFLVDFTLLLILGVLGNKSGNAEISGNPWPVRICGFFLIGLWAGWRLQCLATLRTWVFNNKLCTSGPYRLVRHPLYAGVLYFANPGIALALNSWMMMLSSILLFPILALLVRKEEAMMTFLFGEDYARYASRTGHLFPRMKSILTDR
jgi:protein-S-isoprenylcysteine O-methyltransferase Ste14